MSPTQLRLYLWPIGIVEGNCKVPFFFYRYSMTNTETIKSFIEEALTDSDCYLVEFVLKPTNQYKVYLDSDSGFTLEKSIFFNRQLRKRIDESGMYPEGEYSLEVSSPGVDTPLTLPRQYRKNLGRKLEIIFTDEEKGTEEVRLIGVEEDFIQVEILPKTKRGRVPRETGEPINIAWNEIKKATVQVEF